MMTLQVSSIPYSPPSENSFIVLYILYASMSRPWSRISSLECEVMLPQTATWLNISQLPERSCAASWAWAGDWQGKGGMFEMYEDSVDLSTMFRLDKL